MSGRSGISVLLGGRSAGRAGTVAPGVVGPVAPGVAVGAHEAHEPVEQVLAVVGAGGGLGVVLDGEGRQVQGAQPLDDAGRDGAGAAGGTTPQED